jgi:excisionase family DNA binding protein
MEGLRMSNKPEFYTVREFAELLKMAEKTVRANINAGVIKAVKIGKCHRIPVEEVDRLKREAMKNN